MVEYRATGDVPALRWTDSDGELLLATGGGNKLEGPCGLTGTISATEVELGAGTGPITAELVKHVKPHTKLLVIELDPELCARLKSRFPQVDVVQGDACDFDKLLAERGFTQVDHVCSGLPLPSFPAELRETILATSARMLAPGGTFRQLTVMPLIYYRMYCRYFNDVRFSFVPLNVPPGGVYVCRGYRDAETI